MSFFHVVRLLPLTMGNNPNLEKTYIGLDRLLLKVYINDWTEKILNRTNNKYNKYNISNSPIAEISDWFLLVVII